jgi:hypothetical protein
MTICATCASKRRVKVVRLLNNPYLEEATQRFEQDDERERARFRLYEAGDVDALRAFALHQPSMHRLRDELTSRYAWAIPNEQALAVLAKHAPLVEIGAGTGYWAWLLRNRGVDILAYDKAPPTTADHQNRFHRAERLQARGYERPAVVGTVWTEVLAGESEQAGRYPDRTLFLCWPPYGEPMASACLRRYEDAGGHTVVSVGEDRGCTADEAFHDQLERHWRAIQRERVRLPVYPGVHDLLTVWVRRTPGARTGQAPR